MWLADWFIVSHRVEVCMKLSMLLYAVKLYTVNSLITLKVYSQWDASDSHSKFTAWFLSVFMWISQRITDSAAVFEEPSNKCWRKDLNTSVLITLRYWLGQLWKQTVFSTPVIWNLWWTSHKIKSHSSCWCLPAKLMSSTSLVRCKLWNLFPLLTPDVSISPHSPHPRYNELDWVSRLQTHLCPNRLWELGVLCEGPGTNLLPFSRAWEVCKKSDCSALSALWSAQRGTGL